MRLLYFLFVLLCSTMVQGQNIPFETQLRQDGYYNLAFEHRARIGATQNYKIVCPIHIISTSRIMYIPGSDPEGVMHSIEGFIDPNRWHILVGNYSIQGNKIKAELILRLNVWGMRGKSFWCHYEGTIKNKDTIENWHMVPPLPKANPKFNDDFKGPRIPKTYYFVESKSLLGLDSLYHQRLRKEKKKKCKK